MEVIAGLALALGLVLLAVGVLSGEPAAPALGAVLVAGALLVEVRADRLPRPAAAAVVVGVLLLLLELAVASGAAGLVGGGLVVGALALAWDGGAGLGALALALAVGLGWLLWRTRQHEGVLLTGGLGVGGARPGAGDPPIAPGTSGTAVTALRPGGTARLDGRDLEVRLVVGSAEPGDAVTALRTEDGVVVVERR